MTLLIVGMLQNVPTTNPHSANDENTCEVRGTHHITTTVPTHRSPSQTANPIHLKIASLAAPLRTDAVRRLAAPLPTETNLCKLLIMYRNSNVQPLRTCLGVVKRFTKRSPSRTNKKNSQIASVPLKTSILKQVPTENIDSQTSGQLIPTFNFFGFPIGSLSDKPRLAPLVLCKGLLPLPTEQSLANIESCTEPQTCNIDFQTSAHACRSISCSCSKEIGTATASARMAMWSRRALSFESSTAKPTRSQRFIALRA